MRASWFLYGKRDNLLKKKVVTRLEELGVEYVEGGIDGDNPEGVSLSTPGGCFRDSQILWLLEKSKSLEAVE